MELKKCKFVVLDTETTGLNCDNERIIELAAVKFGYDGKIIDTFESLIDPQRPVPDESTAVHGINDDMLEGKPVFSDIALKFKDFIKDTVVVGHNVIFDIKFLNAEFKRSGLERIKNKYIDTLPLSRKLLKGLGSYKLSNIAKHLGVKLDNAHRALYDVYATKDIFMILLEKSNKVDLDELINLNRRFKTNFRGNYFIYLMGMYILGIAFGTHFNISYTFWKPIASVTTILSVLFFISSYSVAKKNNTSLLSFFNSLSFKTNSNLYILLSLILILFGTSRYCYEKDSSSPTHISKYAIFLRSEIIGTIVAEPDVKDDSVRIVIEPEKIRISDEQGYRTQNRPDFKATMKLYESLPKDKDGYITVTPKSGYIRAFLYNGNENPLFFKLDRGDTIYINSTLMDIESANNPGGFDNKIYHNNQNIYAMMKVRDEFSIEQRGQGKLNPIVKLALEIKLRLLKTIKKTMPYPESSFLGGVMLGLKSGLTDKIQEDAKSSGVGHVFAVSGLHVTILTFMFYGLFSLLKIRNKIFTPAIFFLLIIFTIITGARPSTLRAAIMNSLVLLFYVYLQDYGLRSSIILGLSTSAALILSSNPLMLVDPSFALSFMAILSLGLLTTPTESFLKKHLNGLPFFSYIIFIILSMFYIHYNPDIVQIPFISFYALALFAAIIYASKKLEDKKIINIKYGFRNLPGMVSSFLSAQCAIFFGMMGPLSAFYFHQTSISAPFANIIAIPMIGVIVQLGFIAGMMAMLPFGIYPALLLSAGNWIAVRIFLGTSSFFAENIPFPISPAPTFIQLMIYFVFVAAFIYRYSLTQLFKNYYSDLKKRMKYANRFMYFILLLFIASLFLIYSKDNLFNTRDMKTVFFDVRYGNAAMIQCPGGKTVLIDGGFYDIENPRSFPVGERTIMPTLSYERVLGLDTVYLTSIHLEHIGGLLYVLDNFHIKKYVDMFSSDEVYENIDLDKFSELPQIQALKKANDDEYIRKIHVHYLKLMSIVKRKGIKHYRIDEIGRYSAGNNMMITPYIVDTDNNAKTFDNYTYPLMIEHAGQKIFYSSDIDHEMQLKIMKSNDIKAHILLLADHGAVEANSLEFLNAVDPEKAVLSYRFDNYNQRSDNGARNTIPQVVNSIIQNKNLDRSARVLYSTENDGAIIIKTNDDDYVVEKML